MSRKGKRSGATAGRNPKRLPDDTRPPYARNPHRVASVADIEARARRLFDPLKQSVEQPMLIKLPSLKALRVNRQASTVAAYFTRQAEHNQLIPAQRHALRRVNKQFFDLRRSVFSDQRLTRQDKAQLVSVLTFERLKAREAIHNPQHHNEAILMGSAEIRKLMAVEEPEDLGFSISGPSGPDTERAAPEGVRARTKQLLDKLSQRLDPKPQTASERERERELNAKDLYTRKSKFSQNVHYLDKTTNKTLFVDTGKAIAMRRTGITESGVAVALQLAKERFGSTLTINGTADFKKLVIEAAAKSGMDIHFTDKSMNEGLSARRAELEIEREGQGIAQPSAVDLKVVQAAAPVAAAPAPVVPPTVVRDPVVPTDVAKGPSTGPEPIQFTHNGQPAILDLSRYPQPGAVSPPEPATQSDVVTQGPSELAKMDTQWRESLDLSEHDIAGSASAMQIRGENHANWLFGTADQTPDALAMITQYMQNDSYRESFKIAIEDLYVLTENVPDARAALDAATGFVEDLVNRIETQEAPADASKPADRRVIQGELVAHGAAPYQHNEKLRDKPLSYFVTVKPDGAEPRTVWGVGLADVMSGDPSPFKEGDRIRLVDLGTQPVTVPETQPDGSTLEKLTHRRQWAGQMEGAVQVGPVTAPVPAAAAVMTPVEPPMNAGDVARHTRALTNEVSVQSAQIAHATQRLGELVNLRDNHSAGRDAGYVDQLNADIGKTERFIAGASAILGEAQASLQKLAPVAAASVQPTTRVESPAQKSKQVAPATPVTILQNGEPVSVDPTNAGDVARHTRELTNEVSVQSAQIAHATQRLGELVNLRDNHSAGHDAGHIDQLNADIGKAERFIAGASVILAEAQTSLQTLGETLAVADPATVQDEGSTPASDETRRVAESSAVVIEAPEEHEMGMD